MLLRLNVERSIRWNLQVWTFESDGKQLGYLKISAPYLRIESFVNLEAGYLETLGIRKFTSSRIRAFGTLYVCYSLNWKERIGNLETREFGHSGI